MSIFILTHMQLSIQFPLTREDKCGKVDCPEHISFNPLPSHEGRLCSPDQPHRRRSFNPLPSHEGRLPTAEYAEIQKPFNPLPSHEGRLHDCSKYCTSFTFQSTSLSRGKTSGSNSVSQRFYLSIHFPLTREDMTAIWNCGTNVLSIHFPLTREDELATTDGWSYILSIHFPLTREDHVPLAGCPRRWSFNPLPSHEGRHYGNYSNDLSAIFQSTSLSRGKTLSR